MAEVIERILVVDDQLGIRAACKRVLEPAGYVVEAAETGRAGLEQVQQQHFDLVLLDVVMPDVRGIDLLEPIHAQDPDTVCIIITGYATIELAVQAIKAGAYDFLAKPFSADVLLMAVQKGLERRRLSLEAQRLQAIEREAAELARAGEALERMDRFKTAFTLTVAHELRAPLTAIQSFLVALQEGYFAPEQREEVLQRAVARIEGLLELVDDLLKIAAARGEMEVLHREPLCLADVLETLLPLFRVQAEEKGLSFSAAIRCRPQVTANSDQMVQLWSNLISNAIKYTSAGGSVRVMLDECDGWAVGAVEDTGIGIALEEQGKVFEEFHRTAEARQVAPHGTGLGLALVRHIVEGHGGTIALASAPHEGSCFTFHLPQVGKSII
ncbi:MAG: hybrid sensor histidine kinase/response regulator [Anaerolineae bacterium]|nr:hybrid sensor histidine kinase/response regulator [Anaerolineae bacterium]